MFVLPLTYSHAGEVWWTSSSHSLLAEERKASVFPYCQREHGGVGGPVAVMTYLDESGGETGPGTRLI